MYSGWLSSGTGAYSVYATWHDGEKVTARRPTWGNDSAGEFSAGGMCWRAGRRGL